MAASRDFTVDLVVGIKDLFRREARAINREARDLNDELEHIERGAADADDSMRDLARGTARAGHDITNTGRDMGRTENATRELARGAGRAAQAMDEAGREIADTGRQSRSAANDIDDLGDALGKRLVDGAKGFLAVAGGGALGAQVVELDTQIRQLAAGTELSVDQAKELEKYFRGAKLAVVGSNYSEIQEAVRQVMQDMQLQGAAAFRVAEQAMMLQKVHPEQDVSGIIRAAAAAAKAWKKDPVEAMDLFTVAIEQAGDASQDMLDTFFEYSDKLAEGGLGLDQTLGMFIGGKRTGVFQYDKIADIFKEGFKARVTDADQWKKLIYGTTQTPGVIDALLPTNQAEALKGQLTELRTAIQMGTDVSKLQARVAALKQELQLEISGGDGRTPGHGPKARAIEDQISKLMERIDAAGQGANDAGRLWAKVMGALADIAEADPTQGRNIIEGVFGALGAEDITAGQLRAMSEGIMQADQLAAHAAGATARAYDETTTFFDRLSTSWGRLQQQIELGLEDVLGWLAPVGDALIWIIDGAADLAEEFRGLALGATAAVTAGGALSGIGAVLGALGIGVGIAGAPIWLIVLALGAVVAAGYEVVENWEWIKAEAERIWGAIVDWWESLDLSEAGPQIMEGLGHGLIKASFFPLNAVLDIAKGVKDAVSGIDLTASAVNITQSLANGVRMYANITIDAFGALVTQIRQMISGWNLLESGKALMHSLAEGIKQAGIEVYNEVKESLAKARELLPFSDAHEGPLSDLTLSGRRFVETLASGVTSAGPDAIGGPLASVLAKGLDALDQGAAGRRASLTAGIAGITGGGVSPTSPGGAGTGGAVVVNQHFTVNATGGDGRAIGSAVVDAIRERSTDFLLELERALEDVWSRQAFRTYGL